MMKPFLFVLCIAFTLLCAPARAQQTLGTRRPPLRPPAALSNPNRRFTPVGRPGLNQPGAANNARMNAKSMRSLEDANFRHEAVIYKTSSPFRSFSTARP